MVKTETEDAIASANPSGWKHTFYEDDRLRRLERADLSLLGDTVDEYGGKTVTENDVIRYAAERVLTSFLTPEKTIEFPGLGLAVNGEMNLLEAFAALYKADNDTPSGTIKDPVRAGTDDIVFTFATPEVYNEIAGTSKSDYLQGTVAGGDTVELVGDQGIDAGSSANGSALQLDADEYMFFTGDFIDLADGKGVVTATQIVDVDGRDFGPVDATFSARLSGAHILTTQGTYATTTIDIDAKAYAAGDPEVVPIAFYMGPGSKAPSLV